MDFRRNHERSRYELLDDGEVAAFADYSEAPGVVVFPHTVVIPELRGRGLGALLVRQALDDVRTSGRQVVATCWYVADFIAANPAYQDLRAA
ncbi:MAG: GNAT family N-acetyltransferase [Mycobacteriales bacterium]